MRRCFEREDALRWSSEKWLTVQRYRHLKLFMW